MIEPTILFSFFSAFAITAVLTPLCIPLIKKLGLVDDPKTHMHPALLHTKPIPRAGGIPLFLGIFIPALFLLPKTPIVIFIFLSSFLALVV
ncbi:MAG TPA: hypothetical protein VEW42_03000, partial [Candidatus Eisenbacteria bacterium]|nr:hypothetical protein [Candidatus Eisenbacteria bacterium]